MRRHLVSGRRHSDKCRYSDRRFKRDTSCRLADADKSVGDDNTLCLAWLIDGGDFFAIEGDSSSHLARWHEFGDALALEMSQQSLDRCKPI